MRPVLPALVLLGCLALARGQDATNAVPPVADSAVPVPSVATGPAAPPVVEDPVFKGRMYRAMRQADEHAAKGQWGEAQAILLDLIEKAPENQLLIEKTALLLTVQEKWRQALDQWQHLFAKAQSRYDVLVKIGRCQALLGRLEESGQNLLLASQLSPEPLEARFWLCAVQNGLGQTNEASRTLGLLNVQQSATLLYWLASDAIQLRQVMGTPLYLDLVSRVLAGGAAGDPLRMAAVPEAEWNEHLRRISGLLVELEHRMEARESTRADEVWHQAQAAGASGPMFEAYRAMILGRLKGKAEAGEIIRDLIKAHPDFATLRHLHGILLLETKSYAEAIPVLREAASATGNQIQVSFALACALAGARKEEEAFILLDALAERKPAQLLRLLQLGPESLENLRFQPRFSDLMDRLRNADL